MRAILWAVVLMLVPAIADATCTWTTDPGTQSGNVVCTSTSETAIAGTAGTSVGWALNLCPKGVYITACVDSGKQVTAALTLSVYGYNPRAALWAKWPDRNYTSETISAAQRCQTWDALWTVVGEGRWAVIPTAGTIDAGNLTIYWACN